MNSGQKIPGYSGHIPCKMEIVGHTTGESNKQAGHNFINARDPNASFRTNGSSIVNERGGTVMMRSTSVDGSAEKPQKYRAIGNMSKTSVTWMNGPMHNIRNQCIPGYTGFVSGITSENLYGKSYAENTAKSFKSSITRGFDHEPNKRFKSQNQKIFKETNMRRVSERPDFASRRDYMEYMMTLNQDSQVRDRNREFLNRTGAFDKFNNSYTDTTGTTVSPRKHTRDLLGSPLNYFKDEIQVKPRVVESKLTTDRNFNTLSEPFKHIFSQDETDQHMRLPIVGYQGHRKGEKAENMFARNFRETTMEATKNLRAAKARPNFHVRQKIHE